MGNTGDSSISTPEGFIPFTLNPSHPLYVLPSDSPGSQLVHVPFDGHGFVLWRSNMLTSLSAKSKLGLLDGKINQPSTDSPYYPYWERCNDMVKAWITNSVSRDIAISVICFRTAKEFWTDIKERFGQSNGSKYLQILREISGIVQGSSDIATYFTKLRNLWDELNSSYVGPTCSCGALPKFIEDQQLFQFLNGLNDSYSTVKSEIMIMSPLPPISKAYSLLQQDASQREILSTTPNFSTDSSSFSVSSTPHTTNRTFTQKVNFDSRKNMSSVSCKYCKKPDHTVDKCYRLDGFPADFKFTKSKKSDSCVQSDISHGLPSISASQPSDNSPHGFTKEQYQHLMSLFQQVQVSPGPNSKAFFWLKTLDLLILQVPSLKRPLVIGKAAGRLYYLHPDADLFPDSTNVSFSSSVSYLIMLMNLAAVMKLLPYLLTKGFCIKPPFLTLPNKMGFGRDKFQSRAIPSLFLGYPCGKKGYKLLNLSTYSIFHSRDIVFHENIFPVHSSNHPVSHPPHPTPFVDVYSPPVSSPPPFVSSSPSSTNLPISPCPTLSTPSLHPPLTSTPVQAVRKSTRTVTQPSYLKDYICSSILPHVPAPKVSQSELHMHEPQFYQHRANSSLERYKARLVIKGDTQKEGIDFIETFSLVVKLTTIKCLITLAVKRGWTVYQLDVDNGFLHGNLHEEVYMKIPPGLDVSSIFASPRLAWLHFSLNDYSIFTKSSSSSLIVLAVYVDDILWAGDDVAELDSLKLFLDSRFKIKDLGTVHYFIGLEISYTPQGYLMSLSKYTTDLLAEFNCQHFSPHLSQFLQHPQVPHMLAALHGSYSNSHKFVSGYYITLGDRLVSWKSKKQPTISLSSAEAKYRALRKAATKIAWLIRLLGDLSLPITAPVPMYCYSQAALHIAKNPVFHERTKYIEIDCHYVRECLHVVLLSLHFVSSTAQLADIMTKDLSTQLHYGILGKLGVSSPSSLKGGGGVRAQSDSSSRQHAQ
uniref:Uncharacterized protein LOC104218550 n=1 Tax=Nicotiana sylvestris TaxID=4096 RepID=A0A1U7VH12_NICSY|nr:PREDICTED: uncharacterized protein LOC104218550 [Nicotiana sylvestris]